MHFRIWQIKTFHTGSFGEFYKKKSNPFGVVLGLWVCIQEFIILILPLQLSYFSIFHVPNKLVIQQTDLTPVHAARQNRHMGHVLICHNLGMH